MLIFPRGPTLWTVGLLATLPQLAGAGALTPAGTVISNVAQVSFSIEGEPDTTLSSLPATLQVQELLGLAITTGDMGAVAVNSPDDLRPLSFTLVNTGNGPEAFSLARTDVLTGDQFDPAPQGIFLESGAREGFQATGPDADVLYVQGNNDPALEAGASVRLYLVGGIPAGLTTLDQGFSRVSATALTAGPAAPGTVFPGAGAEGVDVVVGLSGGMVYAQSVYTVSGVLVTLSKDVVSVVDPWGGSQVMSGAVVRYRIVVDVTGDGVATGLEVSDPLPPDLAYVPGSLRLDGAARTDAADGDNAEVVGNAMLVRLGNVDAPTTHVLEISAHVN